jgi:transcriptional regulator with XRE-family HTH domain
LSNCVRLVKRIKAQRIASGLNQKQAGLLIQKSRQWVAKVEMCELRLDVLHFVRLCQVYHLKASDLIKDLEEESPDDSSFSYFRVFSCSILEPVLPKISLLFCRIFPFTNQGLIGVKSFCNGRT